MGVDTHVLNSSAVLVLAVALDDLVFLGDNLMDETETEKHQYQSGLFHVSDGFSSCQSMYLMGQIYRLFQFKCKFLYFKSNFSFLVTKTDNKSYGRAFEIRAQ